MPFDVNGDLCPGVDPNCANLMPYDVNGNPCPGTPSGASSSWDSGAPSSITVQSAGGAAPASGGLTSVAGAPSGSVLLYQGTWQVTLTLNVNTIISRVSQMLQSYGLQVATQSSTGGAFTVGNFNIALTLKVTGSGFAQPSDAGSIVDHAYYTVVGRMPVSSSTFLQSMSGVPSNVPGSTTAAPGTLTAWLEQNALWLGLGLGAIVVLPNLVKKL